MIFLKYNMCIFIPNQLAVFALRLDIRRLSYSGFLGSSQHGHIKGTNCVKQKLVYRFLYPVGVLEDHLVQQRMLLHMYNLWM